MSGHSKFANIKHKKEKNDAAKGKIFTMIGRELAVAVKEGGPDPANNFKLAQVVAKAKANNMPNDTIERGIKKAAGDGNSVNYETATYEGYGPSGTAIIVSVLQTIRIVQRPMSAMPLQRAREASVHRDVYHTCLTRRVRSSSTRKSAIWRQMI